MPSDDSDFDDVGIGGIGGNGPDFDFEPDSTLNETHTYIANMLGLSDQLPSLNHVFYTVASLCDPFTQPEENEHSVLSLDCISDLVIAISYSNLKYSNTNRNDLVTDEAIKNPELQSLKFDLSLAYFTILQAILAGLNCDDELHLRYVNNDEENFVSNLTQWTPNFITEDYELKICYRMVCVLLMCIYKLFKPPVEKDEDDNLVSKSYNLSTNPYLHYFIKVWKCQTNVILLGLEIDRRLEKMNLEQPENSGKEYVTPFIVHATLKGSSAIRYVVTWILNQNPSVQEGESAEINSITNGPETGKAEEVGSFSDIEKNSFSDSEYDIKCESLLNFIHPLARKKVNGGALLIDMRFVVIALLIVNSGYSMRSKALYAVSKADWDEERYQNQNKPIAELGDILIDLEYEDRFDEDIRYIFDWEGEWEDEDEEDEEEGEEEEPNKDGKQEIQAESIKIKTVDEKAIEEKEKIKSQLSNEQNGSEPNGNEGDDTKNGMIKTASKEHSERFFQLKELLKKGDLDADELQNWLEEDAKVNQTLPQENAVGNGGIPRISTAVRSEETIEFDDLGRDWRDHARGENTKFRGWFLETLKTYDNLSEKEKEDPDDFFSSWKEFEQCLEFLLLLGIESNEEGDVEAERKIGQSVLNTIAKAIKDEEELKENNTNTITPDKIYNYWSSLATELEIAKTQDNNKLIIPIFGITKFELLLHNNGKLTLCMLDEMLMCKGYRRVLIWFITHNVNLSPPLINYVFELLVGLRGGESEKLKPYKFSREGPKIVLSEIEVLMLLHEFISTSGLYLLATKDGVETFYGYKIVLLDSIARKYLTLMCLLIDLLINVGVIDLNAPQKDGDVYDYTYNLQFFLITWIGKLPEARTLFFKIKQARGLAGEVEGKPANSGSVIDTPPYTIEQLHSFVKYIEPLSMQEINDHLTNNSEHFKLLREYSSNLEVHIKWLLCQNDRDREFVKEVIGPKSSLTSMQEDFQFFLENFNTLCKIDFLAEFLFRKIEKNIQTGLIFTPLEVEVAEGITRLNNGVVTTIGEENEDSEFNGQFLDGIGQFSESNEKEEEPSGKKKKSKKKKKGKKK